MKWNKFIEDYNELTLTVFNKLVTSGKKDSELKIFLFTHPVLNSYYFRYYYTYDSISHQINYQMDKKTAGHTIECINIFNDEHNIISLYPRHTIISNWKFFDQYVHRSIFLWTYFLMLTQVINYELEV